MELQHDDTHNGWTNYATWRVNLEVCDGMDADAFHNMGAGDVREYVEEIVFMDATDGLAKDYARAFLSEVNWNEIRNHYQGDE